MKGPLEIRDIYGTFIISMYHFSMKPFIAFCFHSIIKNLIFTSQTLITLFDHDVDAFSVFCGCMFAQTEL